jgi:hypothetical protein
MRKTNKNLSNSSTSKRPGMSKRTCYVEVATRDVRSRNCESLLGNNGGDNGIRRKGGGIKQVGDQMVMPLVLSDQSRGREHLLVLNCGASTSKSCRTNEFDDSCHVHRRCDISHESRDVELTGQRRIAKFYDGLLCQTVRGNNSKRYEPLQRVDAHLKNLGVFRFFPLDDA